MLIKVVLKHFRYKKTDIKWLKKSVDKTKNDEFEKHAMQPNE